MNVLQTIPVALRALMTNKMRSFLTTLGVVIGVAAVIAMTAIGAGAKERVQKTFEALGSNMLVIHSGSSRMHGVHTGAGTEPSLTWDDLAAIRTEIPAVRYAAPELRAAASVVGEGQNWGTIVEGTTPDFFKIRNWEVAKGRAFDDGDVATGAKVAFLGKTVVENIFGPYANPVGQVIRVNNTPLEVIGVAKSKGQSPWGQDFDDVVFIPVSTFRQKIQGGLAQFIPGSIFVGAVSQADTDAAQKEIEALLRRRHHLRTGQEDDFTVRNLSDMAQAQQEGAQTMTSLLAGIALVSLIVGGIGIMNIMLVSVTERTREIGLRMAVGAKPRSILAQFMAEAMTLSLLGGAVGVGSGLGAAKWLVARFDWPMLVQPQIILIALVFSGIVGIAFGLYPAFKASRLDPIQALRYE